MPFNNSYGATENGNVLSAGNDIRKRIRPTDDDLPKVESSFVELKLIDEDWNEVEGRGELATRGPRLCSGYIKNEEEGTYHFLNRRKHLIKSGAKNIYPAEIEKMLVEHEAIEEAILVHVSDEKWGEVPRAVVSTYDEDAVDIDDLMDNLSEQLASYKRLQYFGIVYPDEFSRSATSRIVRGDIKSWNVADRSRVREV